jgi:hypothetical protein
MIGWERYSPLLIVTGRTPLVRLHLAPGLLDDVVKLLVLVVIRNFFGSYRSGYDEKDNNDNPGKGEKEPVIPA